MSLSNSRLRLLNSAAALLLASVQALPTQAASTLDQRLTNAIRGGDYQPPSAAELVRAEALFHRLATGVAPSELTSEASALKLNLESQGPLILVSESEDAKLGRGFFIFRRAARPDVLLIPHGFKDEMTREIGLHLFNEGSFSAAAWNTVPRDYLRGVMRVDADLAHLKASWFNAFTLATARAWPNGQTVQLHGFEQGKRQSEAGAKADIILSNGTRNPHAGLRQLSRCLGTAFGTKVLIFPDEVRELGGTTNAQAAALRSVGYPAFVHLEASKARREMLRDDAASRSSLLICLQQ
ncbi:MAG: hypothetical protein KBH08_00135 [Brachymonas sp.]|nr:hypothetical protein [Brachymonas sp.]